MLSPGKQTLCEGLAARPAPPVQRAPVTSVQGAPVQRAPAAEAPAAYRARLSTLFGAQRAPAGPAGDSAAVHAAAAQGIATPAQALPFADQVQRSFGDHDVSSIQAHVGMDAAASAQHMGARAYATGHHVVFGGTPDLHTTAHEAAHVVQQRGGVQLKGDVGQDGDAYERNADAVADRVVAGQSAVDLLGAARSGAPSGAIQMYREYAVAQQRDDRWLAGKPVRVSEDGRLAVGQDDGYGSHDLWADAALIEPANHVLQTHGSHYRVTAGGTTLTGPAPRGDAPQTLTKVVPEHGLTGDTGDAMTMPDDCGMGAHEMTGAVDDDGKRTEMVAVIYDIATTQRMITSGCEDVPMRMKRAILLPFIRAKSNEEVDGMMSWLVGKSSRNLIDMDRLRTLDAPLRRFRKAAADASALALEIRDITAMQPGSARDGRIEDLKLRSAAIKHAMDETKDVYHRNLMAIDDLIVAAYDKLRPDERDDFERRAGINRYAAPELGQAYTISTGGAARNKRKPDHSIQTTYNVHWAAVVMKSADDTVTMENSAEHIETPRNKNWIFQMYGAASDADDKRGQTFHEQNRDTVGAHGTSPTTMVVGPR